MRFTTGLPSGHVVLSIRDCLVCWGDVEFADSSNKIVSLETQEYVRLTGRRLVRVSAGSA